MAVTAILNVFVRKEIRRWCGVLNKDLCIEQKKHFSISTDLCQCLSQNQNVNVKAKYYGTCLEPWHFYLRYPSPGTLFTHSVIALNYKFDNLKLITA